MVQYTFTQTIPLLERILFPCNNGLCPAVKREKRGRGGGCLAEIESPPLSTRGSFTSGAIGQFPGPLSLEYQDLARYKNEVAGRTAHSETLENYRLLYWFHSTPPPTKKPAWALEICLYFIDVKNIAIYIFSQTCVLPIILQLKPTCIDNIEKVQYLFE